MGKTNVEYADLQITVYSGCPFRCRYCWANTPLFRYRTRSPKPIEEAWKFAKMRKKKTIVVSFTSDPYQPREFREKLTRRVLEILVPTKHKIMILTKNPGVPLFRDRDLLASNVWLGTTVTSLNDILDEPLAPPNSDRIEALLTAHETYKIKTWMSMEPIIPKVTIPRKIVEKTHEFVDYYVLGKLNYAKRFGYAPSDNFFDDWYRRHVSPAVKLLKELGKPFFIKKELRKVLEVSE